MKSRLFLFFVTLIIPLFAYSQNRTNLSGYVGDELRLELNPETVSGYTFNQMSPIWEIFSAPGTSYFSLAGGGTHAYVNILRYTTGTLIVICRYELKKIDGYGYLQKQAYYNITCNAVTIIPEQSNYKLKVGEYEKINYTINPSNKWPAVIFESDDTSVALVNNDGYVTGNGPGKATITLSSNMGPEATVSVVVEEGPKKLKLAASPSSGEIVSGTIVTLTTTNASGADIYYTMNGSTPSKSSQKYASPGITINEACTLKAIAYKEGYETSEVLTEQYTIKEIIAPTGVEILMPKVLEVGHSYGIRCVVTPLEATTDVTWSSDDESIVKTYANGSVDAKQVGTTYIRATTSNGVTGIFKAKVVNNLPSSTKFDDGIGALSVSSGYNHTMFIKNDGTLWACGSGDDGRLGLGNTYSRSNPYKVTDRIAAVSAGWRHTLLLAESSMLYSCGFNSDGQLGNSSYTNKTSPNYVSFGVKAISAGSDHSLILMDDGSLYTCGSNTYGQLGTDKSIKKRSKPGKVMDHVAMIAAGDKSSYVVKTDGTLWVFGDNQYGNLCLGDNVSSIATPTKLMDDVIFVSASADGNGCLVIKTDGTLWNCTYRNIEKAADDVVFAAKGMSHCVFIKKDGTLWGFGTNSHGETAGPIHGGIGSGSTPQYQMAEGVVYASAGAYRTFFIKEDGTLWACGHNDDYELGDGTKTDRTSPVQILSVKDDNAPVRIELPTGNQKLKRGDKLSLNYTIVPKAYNGTLKWSSDDPSIATVNDGLVEGLKPGSTFINVEAENGKADWCLVTVYVEEIERTVKTSAAGYATFYDSELAYVLPEGLSAQVVTTASNDKLNYKTIANGNASELIPVGVPVMLVSNQKSTASYQLRSTWSEETYMGNNLLQGSDNATMTTGDGYHYKLTYGKSGSNLSNVFGWYWGEQNGGAFKIEGHKAWLVIPKSAASTRGFSVDGNTTGIDVHPVSEENAIFYDLQGRRIEKPAKGVYISRGKKVIIK